MTYIAANSILARCRAFHPSADRSGAARAGGAGRHPARQGIYVYDENGREYLEGAVGLWCAALGFSNERLAAVAYEQMNRLGCYHSYRLLGSERVVNRPAPGSRSRAACPGTPSVRV